MGAARNLDSFSAFDAETVKNTAAEKIELAEAIKIREMRNTITGLIDEACGDREPGKRKEFESRLQQELKASSIDGLNKLNTKVEVYRDNVSKTVEKYFGMIDQNEYDHLFVERSDRNARKLYKEEFLKLNDADREKRLTEFGLHITKLQQTYEELTQFVSPETVKRLRGSERRRLLMYVKGCGRLLSENKDLFSENEVAELKAEMEDCTSPADQQKLMTRIATNLEKRKWYKKVYDRLPPAYQQKWGKIDQMSLDERQTSYEKLVVHIEEKYENILDNHPDRKHIGAQDRANALAYVRSDKISGGDKFRALKGLEKQIQKQKTEVSMPFEASLDELKQHKSPREIKRLRDQFYNAGTYDERRQLAESIKTDLLDAQAESEELVSLKKEYKTKLEADLSAKIIGKKTLKAALKRTESQTVAELTETLSIYKPDRERRVKVLKQFTNLPKEIQDKNTDFFELTHTERVMRMEELSQYVDEQKDKKAEPEKTEPKMEEDVPVQKAEPQKEQITETQEETENSKIEKLMALAASATRRQEYEVAVQHYQEILNIDPQDELAAMSLQFVEGKLKKAQENTPSLIETEEDAKLSEAEKNHIKQAVEEASKNSGVMRRRTQNTISQEATENLKKSQAKHGIVSLENRNKNKSAEESQMNKQVIKETGATKMMVNGKAENVIWMNDEGYRDQADRSNETKVAQQIAKQSGSGQVMDNIVAHKTDGTLSNASNAEKNLKKRKKETKNIVRSIAKNKIKVDAAKEEALDAALQKEVDKKDLSVQLRAA